MTTKTARLEIRLHPKDKKKIEKLADKYRVSVSYYVTRKALDSSFFANSLSLSCSKCNPLP